MATRPKEIVSEAIDRACVAMVPTSLKAELWSNSNSCYEKRARSYIARVYGLSVRSSSRCFKSNPHNSMTRAVCRRQGLYINAVIGCAERETDSTPSMWYDTIA